MVTLEGKKSNRCNGSSADLDGVIPETGIIACQTVRVANGSELLVRQMERDVPCQQRFFMELNSKINPGQQTN